MNPHIYITKPMQHQFVDRRDERKMGHMMPPRHTRDTVAGDIKTQFHGKAQHDYQVLFSTSILYLSPGPDHHQQQLHDNPSPKCACSIYYRAGVGWSLSRVTGKGMEHTNVLHQENVYIGGQAILRVFRYKELKSCCTPLVV